MTSGLLFLFWLILVIFAIPQLRSEIQKHHSDNLDSWTEFQVVNYITYFTLITIMLILNCFADKQPRISTYPITKSNKQSPEKSTSFLNQIFFQWFTPITRIGYKRPLTEDDIYDMNPENMCIEVIPPFEKYFAESIEKGRRYEIRLKVKTWI